MSTGGRAEYDSAAFAYKNPGPVYRDHYELNVKMTAAFDAYLTQKYGFHGLVNCGRHNTLAEATKWLQGRASQVSSLGNQYKYTATDWSYAAAPVESAPATTTSAAATAPAGQTAASTASEPTTFYFCIANSQGVGYESDVFQARNDVGTARRIQFTYAKFLSEKYKVGAMPNCRSKPTRAEAQDYLQQFSAGVYGGVSQHVATGWVYSPTPPAATLSPVASTGSVSTPVAAKPASPKPVATQPVPVVAAVQPAAPAPAAAPRGVFVVCYADSDPQTRYYNPPVDGGDGNYGTWMPAYQNFMQQKYRFSRSVRCNKHATLGEAQAYYQTTLDQAHLHTSINGIPSPIVITDWKYQ
jgi:hypothetical protein